MNSSVEMNKNYKISSLNYKSSTCNSSPKMKRSSTKTTATKCTDFKTRSQVYNSSLNLCDSLSEPKKLSSLTNKKSTNVFKCKKKKAPINFLSQNRERVYPKDTRIRRTSLSLYDNIALEKNKLISARVKELQSKIKQKWTLEHKWSYPNLTEHLDFEQFLRHRSIGEDIENNVPQEKEKTKINIKSRKISSSNKSRHKKVNTRKGSSTLKSNKLVKEVNHYIKECKKFNLEVDTLKNGTIKKIKKLSHNFNKNVNVRKARELIRFIQIDNYEGSSRSLSESISSVHFRDPVQRTLLHIAVKYASFKINKLLIEAGIDKKLVDVLGRTAGNMALDMKRVDLIELFKDEDEEAWNDLKVA